MVSYIKALKLIIVMFCIMDINAIYYGEEEEKEKEFKDYTWSEYLTLAFNYGYKIYNALNAVCQPGEGICEKGCCICPKGTSSVGMECEPCKEGTYSDKEGSMFCSKCEVGTWSYEGSSYCYSYYSGGNTHKSYS